MNNERLPSHQPLAEISDADLHALLEQPSAPDYSDPNSPDLQKLLDKTHGNVIEASHILLDGMISGEIR
jgi:hypothetical protein